MKKLLFLPLSLMLILLSSCAPEEIDLFADYSLEGTLSDISLSIYNMLTSSMNTDVLYLYDNVSPCYTKSSVLISRSSGSLEDPSLSLSIHIGHDTNDFVAIVN